MEKMKFLILIFSLIIAGFKVNGLEIECERNYRNQTCVISRIEVDRKDLKLTKVNTNGIGGEADEVVIRERIVNFLPLGIEELFPSLTSFKVEWSQLKEISRENFKGMKKLVKLSLRKNLLKEIKCDTFNDLALLKELNLGENNIQHLDKVTFRRLLNLKQLNLESNSLKELHHGLFLYNTKLETLSLEDNELKLLPNLIFEDLRSLVTLRLDMNEITGLQNRLLKTNAKLRELTVSNNLIDSVGEENYEIITKLVTTDFRFNKCTGSLNQEVKGDELVEYLKKNCKAEADTEVKWLKGEVEETRKSKREISDFLGCAKLEFQRNDENINVTRQVLLTLLQTTKADVIKAEETITNKIKNFRVITDTNLRNIHNDITRNHNELKEPLFKLSTLKGDLEKHVNKQTEDLKTAFAEAFRDHIKCNFYQLGFKFLQDVREKINDGKTKELLEKLEQIRSSMEIKTELTENFEDVLTDPGDFITNFKTGLKENCAYTLN